MRTTDLSSTREILDRLPVLPSLVDLSHYAVGQQIALPVSKRNHAMVDRILPMPRPSTAGQLRPVRSRSRFSEPVTAPGSTSFPPVVREFPRLASAGQLDDTLTFSCELGPQPYAIAGPDGNSLSDRWKDAQSVLAVAQALLGKRWSASQG
jgi:hypothetical protein